MRKLYLASIKFKVGSNEFEETRLVASEAKTIEQVSDEAHKTWECEASGTDRVLKNLQISKTLNISDYVDSRKEQKTTPDNLEDALNDLKRIFKTEAAHTFLNDCIKVLGHEAVVVDTKEQILGVGKVES